MYNFLPPTLTHLSRNQQGPQKIWKDWPRLVLYSIAKGGNDMLANSLWSNREMGPRLPSQNLFCTEKLNIARLLQRTSSLTRIETVGL